MKQTAITTNESAPISKEGEGHTPGEWQISNNETTVFAKVGDGEPAICEVKDGWGIPYKQAVENAKLIATAPSLLKQNQQLIKEMEAEKQYSSLQYDQIQQQAKDIELLRDALQDLVSWSNIKDGSPSQYLRDAANKALKQTEPKQ